MWRSSLLGVILLTGCANITDGDQKLNEQNYLAGTFVHKNAESPEVKQAGKDIADNSKALAKTIGISQKPETEYTPELSSLARDQAKQEHEEDSGFFTAAKNLLSGIPWGASAVAMAGGLFTMFKKHRRARRKLVAVYQGVQKIGKTFQDLHADGKIKEGFDMGKLVKDTMRTTATAHSVYLDIKNDLKKLKAKGVVSQ